MVISLDNIGKSYGADTVLQSISAKIEDGNKIGLIGANGSGKTTFVKLLTRLYDPTEGSVTVNGVDIRTLPYAQYNRHVAVVLQDFFLFAYSIQENIVFDSPRITPLCAPLLKKAGW